MRAEDLRRRAVHYRDLAKVVNDTVAHRALLDLAGEYEAQAKAAEQQEEPEGHRPI